VLDGALEALSPSAGAELLGELGVWGAREELEAASVELEGHALSLSLIGTYLDTVYAGDVRKRDHFDFADAVAGAAKQGQRRAKRAQHVMARYIARFAEIEAATGDGGAELAILRMVGLFDRPAPKDALDELLREPAMAGLTDAFHGIDAQERQERGAWAVRRLRALKLLNSEDERDPGALDAHPVVREHFAAELKASAPAAYTEAHSRLYDFYRFAFLNGLDVPDALRTSEAYGLLALCAAYPDNMRAFKEHALQGQVPPGSQNVVSRSLLKGNARRIAAAANLIGGPHFAQLLAKFQPNDEVEMQPCFAAIAHGCAAGRLAEALIELYMPRVRRGNAGFAIRQLGLHGTNLSAISAFFALPFTTPLPGLAADHQALLLGFAGYSLRAVGRLTEAIGTMRLAVKLDVERSRWSSAAVNAGLLSEQQLTLGNVAEALRVGAEAVDIADRSERPFWRITSRTVHGAALHAAGKITDAARLFEEARRMQAAAQPVHAHLYSARGYKYCDLLLTQGRAAEAADLGEKMAQSRARDPNTPLLDHGVETLALGRAHATLAQLTPPPGGQEEAPRMHAALAGRLLDEAVARLIAANEEDYIPAGFLARAAHRRWLYATTRDPAHLAGAEQDLADAEEITRRDEPNGGAMRLYLTDIALQRCRLCLAGLPQALAADPVEPAAPQEASAESPHDSNSGARQAKTAADDWQHEIVDLRREAAAALQDSGPPDASLAAPPKPLRRWDMWSWLEQEKTRAAAAAKQQPAVPAQDAPAGEPAPEAEAPTSAPDTYPLTPEQRELIRQAEAHWQDAARLIEDTGYHRRDGERDDLRRTLDRLTAIE
jgi:hypothetical protein